MNNLTLDQLPEHLFAVRIYPSSLQGFASENKADMTPDGQVFRFEFDELGEKISNICLVPFHAVYMPQRMGHQNHVSTSNISRAELPAFLFKALQEHKQTLVELLHTIEADETLPPDTRTGAGNAIKELRSVYKLDAANPA